MLVQTGNNVGIGGFIITGSAPKNVLVRAIGPTLTPFGVPNVLADPVLELHGPPGFVTIINDNCGDTFPIVVPPFCEPGSLNAAIVATLDPGAYTAIVKGKNNTSGVALVEVYDLNQGAASKLANISTRALVGTGGNIVIAGFILGGNSGNDRIVVRGIGPSLTGFGLPNALANPTLELRDNNAALVAVNNDWQDNAAQAAIITAAGLAPTNQLESGIAATLPPGLYTALLSGVNNGTGIGLVEVYDLGNGGGTPSPTPTPGGTPTPTPTPIGTPITTPSPGGTPTPTPSATPVASPSPSPSPQPPCVENFDGVTAPALPAGWVAINGTFGMPDPTMWVTTTNAPDTAPNDVYLPDQDGFSDKYLISRDINVTSASATLSYRNSFDTEMSMGVFCDGYVLEVSSPNINGGAFTDITDAAVGGIFVTGGYNVTLGANCGSPLSGRMAWAGNSNGYINTMVNLGSNVNGHTIKLRFRMATDEAVSAPGVRIDTLSFAGASCP
jgi:hypothetical protein